MLVVWIYYLEICVRHLILTFMINQDVHNTIFMDMG